MEEEISEKEKRIRKITKLYYSNPKVQESLVNFAKDREVVPRYFEGFGKRPDALFYPSDIMGLVNKGATSFHASIEQWNDALQISSDMSQEDAERLRKGWDLLIDIDSPYIDLSKLAAKLVLLALEFHGVRNYGLKFSGSKGFHVIVPGKAFPDESFNSKTKSMFPEWPRAITQFLFNEIEPNFRKEAGKIISFGSSKEDIIRGYCKNCSREASEGHLVKMKCPVCGLEIERKDQKISKRRLKCLNDKCAGVLEIEENNPYYYCEYCTEDEEGKKTLNSIKNPEAFEKRRGENVSEHAKFDLVLVASRHLFRMPYSLHEKTSLSSIVLSKEELELFSPKDADPLKISIRDFIPKCEEGEARKLLVAAIEWNKIRNMREEREMLNKYSKVKGKFEEVDFTGVREDMFPEPIKKLLKGLSEGKKRGLFIIITFLRSLGYSPEKISEKAIEWNKKNSPPLREGYVKSQLDWHFRQKKKILPPNYGNESFYRDLGLLEKKPDAKNPIVEVMRALWREK